MDPLLRRVRIVRLECSECGAALRAACAAVGHPHLGEYAVLPQSWIGARCPHQDGGLVLEAVFEPDEGDEVAFEDAADSADMVEGPDGWFNMDATKNIGYPAREFGRYGSHSAHDRYDGDSEP